MTKKKGIIAAIIAVVAILIAVVVFLLDYYEKVEYWDLKVGDETVAVFATEEEAKAVIKKIETYYVEENGEVQSVEVTPAVTTIMTSYLVREAPELMQDAKDLIQYLMTGNEEQISYEIKEGDTIWDIAYDYDFTISEIEEMNPDVDLEEIFPGDKLSLTEMNPVVDVKTVQLITSTKTIEYETVEKESDELLLNTTKVKQEGKDGKKKVTELITSMNGKTTEVEVKSSKVLKKPVKEVVLVGTKTISPSSSVASYADSYDDGETYDGDGQAVADFALQFVGNPYSYGGTSLTHGADCSGFVMAVYGHFGISLPHGANWMRNYGRGVPLSEAKPGDIVCYANHCAIYIGGGEIVHAIDYGYGIDVTGLNYSGKPVLEVRRIFE